MRQGRPALFTLDALHTLRISVVHRVMPGLAHETRYKIKKANWSCQQECKESGILAEGSFAETPNTIGLH